MKFSLKIFLTTIVIVCCSFSIGGTLLLSSWLQISIDREIEFAENQNVMLCGSLQTAAALLSNHSDEDVRMMVQDVLSSSLPNNAKQISLRVSDNGNQNIYQTASFVDSGEVFNDVDGQQSGYVILENNGGYFLHYLGHWQAGGSVYELETSHDISFVFTTRDQQYKAFARLTFFLVVVVGLLVFLLSKWLTRPIHSLSDAAKQMSEENYSVRAEIKQRDEIGELAHDFNKMAEALESKIEELQAALHRQERFIGSFAHEVKTPLTSIMGYADLLRSRELPQEKRYMAANNIFKESKRLEDLSFRLLDLIVLGNSELKLEPVSVRAFLLDLAHFCMPDLQTHGIELHTELEDAVIHIDVVLFRTLIFNLLSNAKNAIGDNGAIRLCGVFENSKYRISVSDTGCGIPPEDMAKVTEAFYCVDKARERAKGGAGLGLALCQRIALAHSGKLSIVSEVGCGTTVTVVIGGELYEK